MRPELARKCPYNVKSVEVADMEILSMSKVTPSNIDENEVQCLHVYLYGFGDMIF